MANSMAALECKVTEVKGDVSSNVKCIKEGEGHIHDKERSLKKKSSSQKLFVKTKQYNKITSMRKPG